MMRRVAMPYAMIAFIRMEPTAANWAISDVAGDGGQDQGHGHAGQDAHGSSPRKTKCSSSCCMPLVVAGVTDEGQHEQAQRRR